MNIREIEQQLGIPRANVRYYEKEGLLHPARDENNYRNYTDADIETLKKIKLLRQLDMPVDTIRAVQAGDVTLEAALDRQSQLLASESAKLEESQTICRSMLSDRVTYTALEPAKYENIPALTGQQQSRPTVWEPPKPPVEGAVWAYSPWQRFWARSFDMGLISLVVSCFLALVFRVSSVNTDETVFSWMSLILSWLLVFALEPLLLSSWGTTPGKWLLGLELRGPDGKKLSYSEGLLRTWRVLGYVYGYHIPFYNCYRHYKAYTTCRDNIELDYDSIEGNLYYSKVGDRWLLRATLSLLLSLLLFVPLEVLIGYSVLTPPNRGDITPSEFFENVNYMSDQFGFALRLDANGNANGKPVYQVETDENGFVTAVILEETGNDNIAALPMARIHAAVTALQGTTLRGLALSNSSLLTSLNTGYFYEKLLYAGSDTLNSRDYTLTVTLEQEGYGSSFALNHDGHVTGHFVAADDCADLWYTFTMRLAK